jgi:mRNA interferase RelE/StbE
VAWTIEYDPEALRDLRKLDRAVQREIIEYMDHRIGEAADPRDFGKPLRSSKFGLWRYRMRATGSFARFKASALWFW